MAFHDVQTVVSTKMWRVRPRPRLGGTNGAVSAYSSSLMSLGQAFLPLIGEATRFPMEVRTGPY